MPGNGHTNDFTGNQVWIHEDAVTTGGAMQAEISHVYNSSEAGTNLGQGYGWRLSCVQRLDTTGTKNYLMYTQMKTAQNIISIKTQMMAIS